MNLFVKTYVEEDPLDEHFEGDTKHIFNKYISHINNVHQELVARNPQGWQDEFESRLEHFATEAGRRQGTHVQVTQEDDEHIINVYSPRAARGMGLMDMRQRTPKEEQLKKLQEQQFRDQLDEAAFNRLARSSERMFDAAIHNDLLSEGSFTLDPDAEDPKDIYRPS